MIPAEVSGRHREMYWVSRVTRAVDEGLLELHSQPIVPMRADSPQLPPFIELLVRLRDDDGELVLPGEFIPARNATISSAPSTAGCLEHAAARLREHRAAGLAPPSLALKPVGQFHLRTQFSRPCAGAGGRNP